MNRAIEFYLGTRHETLKSLRLRNDTGCESGDEMDHGYQYKYQYPL